MHQPYQPPARRRISTGAIVAIVSGVVVVLVCGICAMTGLVGNVLNTGGKDPAAAGAVSYPPASNPPAPKQGHTVRFEVTAASGVATMVNWSTIEDSAIERDVPTPWAKDVHMDAKTGLVGINASAHGRVTCKLYIDGTLVDEGDSDTAVNCSATVS